MKAYLDALEQNRAASAGRRAHAPTPSRSGSTAIEQSQLDDASCAASGCSSPRSGRDLETELDGDGRQAVDLSALEADFVKVGGERTASARASRTRAWRGARRPGRRAQEGRDHRA